MAYRNHSRLLLRYCQCLIKLPNIRAYMQLHPSSSSVGCLWPTRSPTTFLQDFSSVLTASPCRRLCIILIAPTERSLVLYGAPFLYTLRQDSSSLIPLSSTLDFMQLTVFSHHSCLSSTHSSSHVITNCFSSSPSLCSLTFSSTLLLLIPAYSLSASISASHNDVCRAVACPCSAPPHLALSSIVVSTIFITHHTIT